MPMLHFRFEARPKRTHPNSGEYVGAMVSCWIRRDTQDEAAAVARGWIGDEDWAITAMERAAPDDDRTRPNRDHWGQRQGAPRVCREVAGCPGLWVVFIAATIFGADAASGQQSNPATWHYGHYDKNIQRKLTQDTVSVTGATVMEVGIYTAGVIKTFDVPGVAGGTNQGLDSFTLVQATTNVPARVGTRFGFRYTIHGTPSNAPIRVPT